MSSGIAEAYRSAQERLYRLDWVSAANRLGARSEGRSIHVPFFGELHCIAAEGCHDGHGRPVTAAVGLVLYRYLLDFPGLLPPSDRRVTFREIEGSGPLVARFADNTHKIIASHFGHDPAKLQQAARQLSAGIDTHCDGYDLMLSFTALPGVDLYLQFNGAEDDFPASAGLLFYRSSETFLGLQCLFILGTYLTGRLIGSERSPQTPALS